MLPVEGTGVSDGAGFGAVVLVGTTPGASVGARVGSIISCVGVELPVVTVIGWQAVVKMVTTEINSKSIAVLFISIPSSLLNI
jgi:hypothetical protein